jgi:hypothetical protein
VSITEKYYQEELDEDKVKVANALNGVLVDSAGDAKCDRGGLSQGAKGAPVPLCPPASNPPKLTLIKSDSQENLAERRVYGTPQTLKAKPAIRVAVIDLLDILVEKGSSSAFKMRDDFVTPMRG